ncbi:unnamed protein product, partial [Musa textilis]
MEHLASYIAIASRRIPWPPSSSPRSVSCSSEARGNLPLSSQQPRRARHDVRELGRGVSRRHPLCAREERARGAAGGVHLRRVGDRRREVQRLGRDGIVRGGVRARPGHRRDLLERAAEALLPGLLPWLPKRARPPLQSRCSRRYDTKRAPDSER